MNIFAVVNKYFPVFAFDSYSISLIKLRKFSVVRKDSPEYNCDHLEIFDKFIFAAFEKFVWESLAIRFAFAITNYSLKSAKTTTTLRNRHKTNKNTAYFSSDTKTIKIFQKLGIS